MSLEYDLDIRVLESPQVIIKYKQGKEPLREVDGSWSSSISDPFCLSSLCVLPSQQSPGLMGVQTSAVMRFAELTTTTCSWPSSAAAVAALVYILTSCSGTVLQWPPRMEPALLSSQCASLWTKPSCSGMLEMGPNPLYQSWRWTSCSDITLQP